MEQGTEEVIDESTGKWFPFLENTPEGVPHLCKIIRKPQGIGVEHKNVADAQTGITLFLEIQEGKEAMAKGKGGYGRRERRLWQEGKEAMAGGKGGYGRRERRLWQEGKEAMAGGKGGYGRRERRLWQEGKEAMAGGKGGYGRRERRLWQEGKEAMAGGKGCYGRQKVL